MWKSNFFVIIQSQIVEQNRRNTEESDPGCNPIGLSHRTKDA